MRKWETRLTELRTMEDGWLGQGEGEKPSRWALNMAETVLLFCNLFNPHIYPMPDGSIEFEWDTATSTHKFHSSLTFHPNKDVDFMCFTTPESAHDVDVTLTRPAAVQVFDLISREQEAGRA